MRIFWNFKWLFRPKIKDMEGDRSRPFKDVNGGYLQRKFDELDKKRKEAAQKKKEDKPEQVEMLPVMMSRTDNVSSLILVNAVKYYEQENKIDDTSENVSARKLSTDSDEFVINRALLLSKRLEIDTTLHRLKEHLQWVWSLMGIFVAFVSYVLFNSVIGENSHINPLYVVITALAPHLLALVIWIYISTKDGGLVGFTKVGISILNRIPFLTKNNEKLVLKAVKDVLFSKKGLPVWFSGMVSHAIWAGTYFLMLILLYLTLAFTEYNISLGTTILTAEQMQNIVGQISVIPSLAGFSNPIVSADPNILVNESDVIREWGFWIWGMVFVYGFILRLFLCVISWIRIRGILGGVTLNSSDPYVQKLRDLFHVNQISDTDDLLKPNVNKDTTLIACYELPKK